MQIIVRNNELFPVQITFDDNTVVNMGPDDTLTLTAVVGGGIVVQEDYIQVRGMAAPASGMSDTNAVQSGVASVDEGSGGEGNSGEDNRPDTLHTI